MKQNCVRSSESPRLLDVVQLGGNRFDISVAENIHTITTPIRTRGAAVNKTETTEQFEFDRYNAVIEADDYGTFIAGAIHVRYSADDEIALINKGIADAENEEYKAYRSFVADVKTEAAKYFENV